MVASGRPVGPPAVPDARPDGPENRHCLRKCCPDRGVPVVGRALSRTYVTCNHHELVGVIQAVDAEFRPAESGHIAGARTRRSPILTSPYLMRFSSCRRLELNSTRHAMRNLRYLRGGTGAGSSEPSGTSTPADHKPTPKRAGRPEPGRPASTVSSSAAAPRPVGPSRHPSPTTARWERCRPPRAPDRRVRPARIRHARLPIHRCARGRRYGADAPHGFAPADARSGLGPEVWWLRPAFLGRDVVVGRCSLSSPAARPSSAAPVPEYRPRRTCSAPSACPPGSCPPLPARVRALAGRPGRGHPRPAAPGAGRRRTSGPRRVAAPTARRAPARPRDRVHGHHLRPGRGAAAGRHPEAPIGIPRADAGVGVCDSGRRPVPPGTAREIHIGGPSPASGLFGNPEGTARRFVTGPEPGGGRLCAVGDLGRILPDGNVELHGRGTTGPRSAATGSNRPRRNGCRPPTQGSPGPSSRRTPGPAARCRAVRPRPHPLDGVPPVTAGRCARPLAGIIAQLPGWAAPQRLSRTGALPENDHGRANRRALAGTLPTALTRTTAQGLSWTGALPENDHGRASRRALAGTLPTALTRATVQGTAPCEAVAASAPETRTASGTAERSEARAPGAGTGVPDGDAAARGSGWDAGAARRRAAALPGAAGRSRAGGRRRLPRRRLPADPCHAPGHAPDHRTPRRLPRDRRTAGHDRPRSSDTPPARPVALRGADPPPPDAGTVPTSLT